MVPTKKFELPAEVSGRPISNRGVHLLPAAYHGTWMQRANYWMDLMVGMGMSWVVIITDGDSVHEKINGTTPLKLLLDNGIIPIIREGTHLFPEGFMNLEAVERAVDLYGEYGLRPFWILYNEPFDEREWKKKKVPRDRNQAWEIVARRWMEGASNIARVGGYVGFPDGPCYDENPFERIMDARWLWDEGHAFYTTHNYGKGRPLDYPYDAVTRYGAQLTEEDYRAALDDYADDRRWYEEPLELLNRRRRELAYPGANALDDDTCWRGWEKVAWWAERTLGYVPPMALTEGGWCPRDRAGTGPDTDIRWAHSTPKMVAKKTLAMYDVESPFFSICPWLIADDAMVPGGYVGWPYDAWVGWAYGDDYGAEKPVVHLLQRVEPKEIKPRTVPMVVDIHGGISDWSWVDKAHGANYRRGVSNLRLTQVQEYEGRSALEARVVDSAGFPVAGVQFYCYYPGAPAIAESGPDAQTEEWHGQGVPAATDQDGRVSFDVGLAPCAPGKCQASLWPAGKGDLLENVGLLAGTQNRHLNGIWHLSDKDAWPLPPPAPDPEEPPPPPPDPTEEVWAQLAEKLDRIEGLIKELRKE